MLSKIIQFSIGNKLIIGLLTLGLILLGSYEVTRLPIDAVPDITNNQVQVITTAPSLGAPDVERFITFPIEQATRNIAGIIEQRSFSRFGLSLVTVVFDDATDLYWARQQISERLSQVRQQIPEGMGNPELGPVTTGLGEIFQYVVRPKPGYEEKYDLTELRTIQDWIVRRQLLGTPGVADVSSFGGSVKQYEVAIDPARLINYGITVTDIFEALQQNNQNTGGAYIEKGPGVLFIRSEGLVRNIADIENIVLKKLDNRIPLLVKNVATVQPGTAIKYGATTYNNKGEVAGAVVMMLKGENSSKVVKAIKTKIKEIEHRLPEGVLIEPFLDRTKMVNNAIRTVETNLAEGALIVVFILVLFLGNLRAGFIVASVIPLSMLFAIIMMNAFGVSGNLMSLGALDFGLLVDGAVIIVEAVMHRLRHAKPFAKASLLTQHQMDDLVINSSQKMMNAAVFGQVIILIVYLPILTLQGIEGKMFRPMAQTVSFALIGAFLLSITYVPMMSALFLSKKEKHKPGISEKMMNTLQSWYAPSLEFALKIPRTVIGLSAAAVVGAAILFSTLGGEFIPELEEGDFAVDTRVLTGSSLSTTIDATTKGAEILMTRFPEVEKVVSKIGSGEIPTDPMPLEAADMMVILKRKKEWTSAKTFDELSQKMTVALQDLPGVAVGFQFPVQMRFNELMTGAKQDVVCKIFGDNLDTLASYAERLGNIVKRIEGTTDLYIETVTGIPQLVITYKREAMASFGVTVQQLNHTIESAYAGAVAGQVFEGDRRFDIVVRLQKSMRGNIDQLPNLPVPAAGGMQVPLNMVADVKLVDGPYQIQREDAQRRIVVGFNVAGRDVQSIVNELQEKVNEQVSLPVAYYVTYGGQYENLQHATQRLMYAVPLALLLIFILLYFALGKLKYGLLIFSAIPLSAIGGVLALWLRNMPFSISAGVGFIALFGVAVLNGIVLITEMNRLKKEGMINTMQIIIRAAETRLRPVLMTAAVASLGFLPMALSTGAGAEVQRPLATVVIGGLVSATFLTLLVLPCLYLLFEKTPKPRRFTIARLLAVFVFVPSLFATAQDSPLRLDDVLEIARQNNLQVRAGKLQLKHAESMVATARDIDKTWIDVEAGQNNSRLFDSRFSVSQVISPWLYSRQEKLYRQQTELSALEVQAYERELRREIRTAFNEWQYLQQKKVLLKQADSIYKKFSSVAAVRFREGETNLLEKTATQNLVDQVANQLEMLESETRSAEETLHLLLNSGKKQQFYFDSLTESSYLLVDTQRLFAHPLLRYHLQHQQVAKAATALEVARLQPDLSVRYINQ